MSFSQVSNMSVELISSSQLDNLNSLQPASYLNLLRQHIISPSIHTLCDEEDDDVTYISYNPEPSQIIDLTLTEDDDLPASTLVEASTDQDDETVATVATIPINDLLNISKDDLIEQFLERVHMYNVLEADYQNVLRERNELIQLKQTLKRKLKDISSLC